MRTALPDGTVVGYEPLVDDTGAEAESLPVPEEHGTVVVVLDSGTVLTSARHARGLRDLPVRARPRLNPAERGGMPPPSPSPCPGR